MSAETSQVVNLYPDQLRHILCVLDGLDAADKAQASISTGVLIASGIKVLDSDGASVLGFLVDEIGGAWSFRAATWAEQSDIGDPS